MLDLKLSGVELTSVEPNVKADFHSVQNVARSTFCDRSLSKFVQSTTANVIRSA